MNATHAYLAHAPHRLLPGRYRETHHASLRKHRRIAPLPPTIKMRSADYIDKLVELPNTFNLDHHHAKLHVAIIYDPHFESAKRGIDTLISNKETKATKTTAFLSPFSNITAATYKTTAAVRKAEASS